MIVEIQETQQAYKYALAPTPSQIRQFMSHAGAARYAYNWTLDTISTHLDEADAARPVFRTWG
jgi:putative transposase